MDCWSSLNGMLNRSYCRKQTHSPSGAIPSVPHCISDRAERPILFDRETQKVSKLFTGVEFGFFDTPFSASTRVYEKKINQFGYMWGLACVTGSPMYRNFLVYPSCQIQHTYDSWFEKSFWCESRMIDLPNHCCTSRVYSIWIAFFYFTSWWARW